MSSSNDGKIESGSQSKLDIEAFRNHLLNYRYVQISHFISKLIRCIRLLRDILALNMTNDCCFFLDRKPMSPN